MKTKLTSIVLAAFVFATAAQTNTISFSAAEAPAYTFKIRRGEKPVSGPSVTTYSVINTNWAPTRAQETMVNEDGTTEISGMMVGTVVSNTFLRTVWKTNDHAVLIESVTLTNLTRRYTKKLITEFK